MANISHGFMLRKKIISMLSLALLNGNVNASSIDIKATPQVDNITITGQLNDLGVNGAQAQAGYVYIDVDGEQESSSEHYWFSTPVDSLSLSCLTEIDSGFVEINPACTQLSAVSYGNSHTNPVINLTEEGIIPSLDSIDGQLLIFCVRPMNISAEFGYPVCQTSSKILQRPPEDNHRPTAINLDLNPLHNVTIDFTLTGTYEFEDSKGHSEGPSYVTWLNEEDHLIYQTTYPSLPVLDLDSTGLINERPNIEGHRIRFCVQPIDSEGNIGDNACSAQTDMITPSLNNSAPELRAISINGDIDFNEPVIGVIDGYFDLDNDLEDRLEEIITTTWQYRESSGSEWQIVEAGTTSFNVEYRTGQIRFCVRPVAKTGIKNGLVTCTSSYNIGNGAVPDLSVSVRNNDDDESLTVTEGDRLDGSWANISSVQPTNVRQEWLRGETVIGSEEGLSSSLSLKIPYGTNGQTFTYCAQVLSPPGMSQPRCTSETVTGEELLPERVRVLDIGIDDQLPLNTPKPIALTFTLSPASPPKPPTKPHNIKVDVSSKALVSKTSDFSGASSHLEFQLPTEQASRVTIYVKDAYAECAKISIYTPNGEEDTTKPDLWARLNFNNACNQY
ncbi:hypothetical protein [Aeromonas sp. HMWF016]|uniref:hypothetical protein n=2 Tax=Aeromonas TaxID=642 RepID=UPI0011B1D894|nr:hypothetical protein [Aeromonas sp. HMWF016]